VRKNSLYQSSRSEIAQGSAKNLMSTDAPSSLIKCIAEAVAAIVAAGFVISVVYDWGFIRALGMGFAELPTTTADHFRSGLLWFPPLAAAGLVYVAIEFQFQRVERGLTEKEIIESSRKPEWTRKFRGGPQKLFAWMTPLLVITYALVGDAYSTLPPWVLAIVWMSFSDWCYSTPLIKQRRNRAVQLGFTFVPIIGILAYFSGYNAAIDAAFRKPVEVTLERPQPLQPISGSLLRTLDRGVLILPENKLIQFVPWNQVQGIVQKTSYHPFRGLLCEWFKKCPIAENNSSDTSGPAAK
jgi:hypothetical protein